MDLAGGLEDQNTIYFLSTFGKNSLHQGGRGRPNQLKVEMHVSTQADPGDRWGPAPVEITRCQVSKLLISKGISKALLLDFQRISFVFLKGFLKDSLCFSKGIAFDFSKNSP